jgi:uncharacterized membrane protein
VTAGFVLTVGSVAALVYFIHHAAALIQAQAIIARVGSELNQELQEIYPAGIGEQHDAVASEQLPEDFAAQAVEVCATENNYLEALDGDGLMALAEEHDLLVAVEQRPGDFIGEREVIARVAPAAAATEELQERIRSAFVFGTERTQTQDPEFMLYELVEIAVRALSPSINDPATACLCVDRLGAALATVAARPIPSSHRYSANGRLRVVAKRHGFEGLAEAAFNQIRQYGRQSVPVTIRLLEAIRRLGYVVQREEDRETLLHHARMIERGSREGEFDPHDLADVQERFRAVLVALGRESEVQGRAAKGGEATLLSPDVETGDKSVATPGQGSAWNGASADSSKSSVSFA